MIGVIEWFRCGLLFTIGAVWSVLVDMTPETLNRRAFFDIIRLKQKRCYLRQCPFWFNRRCRLNDDL